jgi:hypothetical protein
MTIGEAVTKDLIDMLGRMPKEVLTDVGREYKDSIWQTSRKGKQPDGSGREKLNPKYRRRKVNKGVQPIRDHYYSGAAFREFNYKESENAVGFGYDNAKVYGYMKSHQDKAESGRATAMYPIEKDSSSSEQKEVIQFVENRILDTLTQPRTIRASATTVVRL